MINISPSSINTSSANGGAGPSGLALITSIQILLVQDYDDQLQSLGNQIKGTMKVKKAYREDIEALQNLLTKKTVSGKGDDAKVRLSKHEYCNILNGNKEHRFDPETGELITPERRDGSLDWISGTPRSPSYTWRNGRIRVKHYNQYDVKKVKIENRITQLNQKLDTLNEQSELLSISLQSLTNQRKIAMETVSNIVKKESDTLSSITNNMRS